MHERGGRADRWLAVVAVFLVALGATMIFSSTASASARVSWYPVIRFWNTYDVVTLAVPVRCPPSKPSHCVWYLVVNEPDIPAQTLVGEASGTSGILQVHYPSDFCGVIQADAEVGPAPLLFFVGHKMDIQTGSPLS